MSIRLKLALSIFVVELAFLVLLVARDLQMMSNTHFEYLSKRAQSAAHRLSAALTKEVSTRDIAELQSVATHLIQSQDIVYAVFEDSTGQVLAGETKGSDRRLLEAGREADPGILAAEALVREGDVVVGKVRVGFSTAGVYAAVNRTMRGDILLSLFGLVVIAAVAYGLGAILTRSISQLVEATERISGGDLDTRVEIRSHDEVGRLGRALNSMAFQLKKAFDRIQFSEQQFRFLVENAEDAIFALDLQGRFTHVNPKTEEITGYSARELLRQPIKKVLYQHNWERTREQLEELRQGKVLGPVTVEIIGKSRSRVVEVNAVPIRRDGRVVGVQGIARDVTAREQQRRMKEALFRISEAIVNADTLEDLASEGLQVIDDLFDVRASALFLSDSSASALRLLVHRGWDEEELEAHARSLAEKLGIDPPAQDNGSLNPSQLDLRASQSPAGAAARGRREPLSLPLRVEEKVLGVIEMWSREGRPFTEADRAVVHVIANGLAAGIERKLLEEDAHRMHEEVLRTNARLQETIEKLESTQRQLIQSEKLSAIGQLVSGVAHELNNPLTGVIGFAELLLEQDLDAGVAADLRRIHHEASRCERIVRSLLTIARQSKPEQILVNVNEILEEVIELRRYHLKVENISIRTDLCREIPLVLGDPNQLQQVFLNLVSNAAQAIVATKKPGTLYIRTRKRDDTVRIEVEDDGPGIAPEHINRVFDPFFTTKEVGEGTGLGLSISYSLVEGHGGCIWVESELDKGSTFFVELPACPAHAQASDRADRDRGQDQAAGASILLVDDEEVVLGFMLRLLERDGHRVSAARSARQALDLLQENVFDLVISDVKMPGMNGEEFYEQLRGARPDLADRVVFMTGDSLNDLTRSFLSRAESPVLGKPFTAEQVRQVIKEMLRRARLTVTDS